MALFRSSLPGSNLPASASSIRLQVSESVDGGKSKIVYRGQEEKSVESTGGDGDDAAQ
jgi:hypothetical protein